MIAFSSPGWSSKIAANTPVILLPGLDGTGELLTDLAIALSRERPTRIIAYPADVRLGYDELIAYTLDFLPKDQAFVVLGESFSGPIAIEVAARLDQVRGLVLASSFARHPLPKYLAPFTSMLSLKRMPRGVITAALLGRTGTPDIKARLMHVLAKLPDATMRHRAAEALRVDRLRKLREVTAPLLCLHGRYDRVIGKRSVNEISSVRPDLQRVWFDAAHMLLKTHSQQAAAVIDAFCKELTECSTVLDM